MAINSLNSASKGMSGLASGMDTQSMVDAMLAGTQSKIDKQNSTKVQLGYKQNMYRDIMSSLTSFQSKFMSFSGSSSNLLSSSFYNTMGATSKSTAFKATAGSGAAAGKTTVNSISQLARAYQIKTSNNVTVSGEVAGKLDRSKLAGQDIQIELDGVRKTIKLPGADVASTLTDDDLRTAIQESINKAFGNGINVVGTGSEIVFEASASNREFAIYGDSSAMNVLGMSTGTGNKVKLNMRLENSSFGTPLSGDSFKLTINDVKFEFSGSDDMDSIISKINSSDANVRLRYSSLEDKFIMESTVSGSGATIEMSQEEGNLLTAMFGVSSGNTVNSFTQNSYGNMTGKLSGVSFDYTGGIIGTDDYDKIQASLDTLNKEINRATKDNDMTMLFRVDGEEISVVIPKRADENTKYTIEDVAKAINDNVKLDAKGIKMNLEKEPGATGRLTGGLTLTANPGVKVETASIAQSLLGLGASNEKVATGSSTLGSAGFDRDFDVKINGGGTVRLTTSMTMDEAAAAIKQGLTDAGVANTVDVTFDKEGSKGRFRIFGVDIPITIDMGEDGDKLFGSSTIKFGQGQTGGYTETMGQNAKMVINGVEVDRNSNEFTIDGMSYVLTSTFNETNAADKGETIEVTRDTDKIYDGISKFMEEYNKLLEKAWGMLKSEATYKDYPPLTTKQKESMSDREVELWETKSKEGLLRGDKLLDNIMSTMRNTLLAKPDGAKYSLADLGITTGYDMEKGYGGMLKFSDNTNPGEKLKKIIAEEPEEIERLFSGNKGIINELNKVVTGATSDSPVEKPREYGTLSLVNMAGRTGLDTSSTIYKQVREINKSLEGLNTKYKLEYNRYWKQFSSMEQMISNMNSQSSWLSQQLQ